VRRLASDGEGAILLLDTDAKTVQAFDEGGKPLRALPARGSGYEIKKPLDIALDPFRNLYVADADQGVLVFSPQGQLLTTVTAAELRRAAALTLDLDGSVIVYDDKAERLLRFK
jgi:hypothetical protein